MPASDSTSDSGLATQSAEQRQQQSIHDAYASFKHNAALAFLVGAPILIAIPPRKLDLYTFSLAGAFLTSANYITRESTGRSIVQQFGYQYVQRQQERQRVSASVPNAALLENEKLKESDSDRRRAELQLKAWTQEKASESDWKQRRLKEEQEKLDNGEGYADMIVDQIWDVWNQKKDDEKDGTKE